MIVDERLLVAEHQRRQLEAAAQAVSAGGAALGLHRDAHVLEPGDVATHRPRAHLEPARHLLGGELAVDLQELEQLSKRLRETSIAISI